MIKKTLSFTQSGGYAGLRKGCVVPVDSLAPRAKAALAAVRRTRKDTAAPPPRPTPPHAPDRLLYRLDLEGPTGKKSFHFDDQTIPAKARPLISYLSARALPVRPLK